jgi:O-antigen/teichoic acid export membrane protein
MFKRVYSTKINAIANFAGAIWSALLNIVFVPVYLHYMGIESYGLIGLFISIQAFIVLLDFGLSPTLNRELARLSASPDSVQEMHDIKRTLEIINWIIAVLIALFLCALAPLIAHFWIRPKDLTTETIMQALLIMSVNIAIQFSINFYVGGLMGLQKQLALNLINIIFATLRAVGCFVILAFVSTTLQAFLLWQGLVGFIQVVLIAFTLKNSLPDAEVKGRFQRDLLHKIWRFAAGMTGITFISLILTQTDKVILSRTLSLENFGYYTLAGTISGMSISLIASSITHAVYPQFSQLVSLNDEAALREFYHRSSQIMSVLLIPAVLILALFSYDILLVWTGKEVIAANAYILLSLLAIGGGLNGLTFLPYFLQLAHGWTKLVLYIGIVMVIVLIPAIIFGAYKYGAVGGALGWVALTALFLPITVHLMHRKILKGAKMRWYLEDLALPFIVALLTAGAGRMLLSSNLNRFESIAGLFMVAGATLFFTALSTRTTRDYLKAYKNKAFMLMSKN